MRVPEEYVSSTTVYNRQLRSDGNGRTRETEADGSSCPGTLIVVSNRQPYRHSYDSDAEEAGSVTGGDVPNAETDDSDAGTDDTDGSSADFPSRTANSRSNTGAVPRPNGAVERETGERSISVDEPTGGLTAGLDPVVQQTDGTWIAWGDGDADFAVADEQHCVAVPPGEEAYTLRRIQLSDEAVDSYYRGFSNRVLWPLCHEFLDLVENRSNDFEWYRTVNERFAEATIEHATEDAVIWLQDYHFALAPRMIRAGVPPSATVAQFWHVPWPSAETFRYCPAGGRLLEGLLGNDLLGFHIDRYVDNFLESVDRYLPGATVDWRTRSVDHDGRTTQVVATPMGVDAQSLADDALASDIDRSTLLESLDIPRGTALGLGVDRLDYTKGIPERLAAIERFFERNPSWRGEFTFVQKATPSRTEIETYERHGELVKSEVERINRRFERDEWQPIVYTEEYLDTETLAAYYRHADVMVVSPLLDGMNLVAQEFVAASVDADSCLVLSDRTGAHDRLGSHALSIDPTDTAQFADQLERALTMPSHERQRRMNTLRARVFDDDIESWMRTQFDWIRRVHGGTNGSGPGSDRDRNSRGRTPPV
ncbi:trehalose-6-phosphate synthase [Halosolutus amylolyticus]|uniref:Trehalose-6-phosphate synthase n=1 Tax=Halosolutus amylolyticus TaxID=2932267 RepID=A0ABD5PMG9_9EURY|nr:trehalose-6-phosphate synthase [Halosolutus amylolyticus]